MAYAIMYEIYGRRKYPNPEQRNARFTLVCANVNLSLDEHLEKMRHRLSGNNEYCERAGHKILPAEIKDLGYVISQGRRDESSIIGRRDGEPFVQFQRLERADVLKIMLEEDYQLEGAYAGTQQHST